MKSFCIVMPDHPIGSPLAMAEWIEMPRSVDCRLSGMSPLAMAEWIEIEVIHTSIRILWSPLAMAEWIEMFCLMLNCMFFPVSASDGGVD